MVTTLLPKQGQAPASLGAETGTSGRGAKPSPVKASRQGFICMWHGLGVRGWLRMLRLRPRLKPSYMFRWASITAVSGLTSTLNAVESAVRRRTLERTEIEHPPIFILGHWRSGTTLLHNLMTLNPQFTFPTLYHCMFPGHFLLTERIIPKLTSFLIPRTRPMDNVATSWHTPQEDEIALALDCGLSPYLMVAFPVRPDLYSRYFDPREMTESERAVWKDSLLRLMKRLTIRENKTIVLKSPGHTYRIATLLEMFPNAKFVYLRRDPYRVCNSTMHLRRTIFAENALQPPVMDGSEEEMFQLYEKSIRTYEDTKSLIPEGNLHELSFEDLESDPLGEVARIYRNLKLDNWSAVEPLIRAELPRLASYRKNKFRMDVPTKHRIYHRLKWIFELYGYPARLDQPDTAAA